MDGATYLQSFKSSMSSYAGEDPLDPWSKFVDYLEQTPPADGGSGMSLVYESLVQSFLSVERYADDLRYVNYCIRYAGRSSDPVALYGFLSGRGVGTRTAAFYVAWAQQCERRGMTEEADALFHRAMENQAQPADAVLSAHGSCLSGRNPLQSSSLTNQASNQAAGELVPKPDAIRTIVTVSRSEVNPSGHGAGVHTASQYLKDALLCEGSELSFEEVRAELFLRRRRKREEESRKNRVSKVRQEEELILSLIHRLDKMDQDLDLEPWGGPSQAVRKRWFCVTRRRLQPDPPSIQNPPMVRAAGAGSPRVSTPIRPSSTSPRRTLNPVGSRTEPGPPACVPQTRLPVGTPDFSGVPRGTVRRRSSHRSEGRPPEPEDKLDTSQGGPGNPGNPSHVTPNTSLGFAQATPSRALPSPTVNTKEALVVVMDMFQAPPLLDEPFPSVLHAPGEEAEPRRAGKGGSASFAGPPAAAPFTIFQDAADSLPAPSLVETRPITALAEVQAASKPNDTPSDPVPDESAVWGGRYDPLSSLAACPNSTTDFALLARFASTPSTHKSLPSGNFYQDKENNGTGAADHDAFIRRQSNKLSPIMEQSPSNENLSESAVPSSDRHGTGVGEGLSLTVVQPPPPAALSFRDQTVCPAESSVPEQPRNHESSAGPRREEPEGPERVSEVPLKPDSLDWLDISSPEVSEPDLDTFLSPGQRPQSPEGTDVDLVPDPWDEELISGLLSSLSPPLTSDPRCISWPCNLPSISPKTSISLGGACLRVGCVVGRGAFATVYQASDPVTSEKMALKVQKPANPWEFYISTRLDARLQPDVRRLYSSARALHLFHDGSVLLGELYGYGTLLNAVNRYKGLSDKVMPPPLVMHFTVCILNMVEQLHRVGIVHADVKPDNFLLGDRFLENECFEPDGVDHGLVLIDLGQSIDMELFPEGTAFTARCLTSGFQCTEMLSGKPWSYQTDYFGIAGTVHCMLFGTYMEVRRDGGVWRTNGVFRRNPHGDLWQEFFHTLLNVPACASLPSLRSVRMKLASVLQQNYGGKLSALKKRLVILLLGR
ncbi:mitotic checkpoint serine/threonine-protein kinase BUB1 [Brachionichthys hirsutus]|uniref:mitotic checkpoint serine/threonine-protein kinase BUB1 n=1 Tax=Brachionichthys hirsutus TaxID=412623 RepID=UPI0036048C75